MSDIVTFNDNPEIAKWELLQRKAIALCSSTIVPKEYQGKNNLGNVIIAVEMAERIGATPLMVMQNLYIVHGRPSWSSQFIIAAINTCGRFEPLRFEVTGEGDNQTCVAWTKCKKTGDRLDSSPISIKMAKAEGWYGKNGSKWQTMPDQMLRYRAASFLGRIYAPDVLMGMYSDDEAREMKDVTPYDAPQSVRQQSNENPVEMFEQPASVTQAPAPATLAHDDDGVIIEQSSDGERDANTPDMFESDAPIKEAKPLATLQELLDLPRSTQTQIITLCRQALRSIEAGAISKLDFMQTFPDLEDAAGRAGAGNYFNKIKQA